MDKLIKKINLGVLSCLSEQTFDNIVDQYAYFKNKIQLK